MTDRSVKKVTHASRAADIRGELMAWNPEALLADGLDDALVGIGQQFNRHLAVYSVSRVLQIFMRQGMTCEQALEHFEFNVVGAYVGPNTPVFLRTDF